MIVNVYYRDEENRQRPRRTPIQLPLQHSERLRWNGGYRPTAKREARAVICEINVPESRIDERILPLLKEITQEAPTDGK